MSFTVADTRGVVLGALSGVVGTIAMDCLLYRRYRRAGGTESGWRWESGQDVIDWQTASAPGQIGEKVLRAVTRRTPPDRWARSASNAVHWATGAAWGLQYALAAERSGTHRVIPAMALGPVAWAAGYAVLPLVGVYRPIWKYDARTLVEDLSAHVVYGTTTAAASAVLTRAARA